MPIALHRKPIKKAGVSKDSSLCEAAFHLENIEQTYENLHRLTKPRCLRRKELYILLHHQLYASSGFLQVFFVKISHFFKNFSAYFPVFSPVKADIDLNQLTKS
jgi:hypothetical protein